MGVLVIVLLAAAAWIALALAAALFFGRMLRRASEVQLVPGERIINGQRLYSAAWLNEEAAA